MAFQYTLTDYRKIVFTHEKDNSTAFGLITLGIVFFILGSLTIYLFEENTIPFGIIKGVFPLIGLLFIYTGIKYPNSIKKKFPDEIIFDNANGRIEVNQKMSEIRQAFIYYDQIEGFIIRLFENNASGGTYYTYIVCVLKKDGGTLDLFEVLKEETAKEAMEKLNMAINFGAEPVKLAVKIEQCKKFEVLKGMEKIELSWKNDIGTQAYVLMVVVIIWSIIEFVIFRELVSVFSGGELNTFNIFFGILGVIIGGVFVFFIYPFAKKLIKNATTIYAVVVSKAGLDYIEKSKAGVVQKTKNYPLGSIRSISYSFYDTNTMQAIDIMTLEEVEKKKSMVLKHSIDSIKEKYEFEKSRVTLELINITPVEALYIEHFLQTEVSNRL